MTAVAPVPQPPNAPDPSSPASPDAAPVSRCLIVTGTVQGVGFRPFVYRLAGEEGLVGDVGNSGRGVVLRLSGPPAALDRFQARLTAEAPPLARIERVAETAAMGPDDPPIPTTGFHIRPSLADGGDTAISPDHATCPACLAELGDPGDRRYRYPFLNCTDCGPRYSIIQGLPYDRPATTMAGFPLCAECRAEYDDPTDRRFHAQPIACPKCGPGLWLEEADGTRTAEGDAAIAIAVDRLKAGGILAILGLGGVHLACLATDTDAVDRLRAVKHRPGKPFAIMVRDATVATRFGLIAKAGPEAAALAEGAAPIVLSPYLTGAAAARLAPGLNPGLDRVGVMRPYTPLHSLLMAAFDDPLVMTSGNRAGRPQAISPAEARRELAGIADAFLLHNRPIANRIDDSVVQIVAGRRRVLRRARGYAPAPIHLPPGFGDDHPDLIAYGGDLKAAVALARHGRITLSPHIGDLDHPSVLAAFHKNVDLIGDLHGAAVEWHAVDGHPGYRSAGIGRERAAATGGGVFDIGHHHAHAAAAMVEAGLPADHPPVLAITLDGIGMGADGALWGGDILAADYRGAMRVGGLPAVALPGGDAAAREPWRPLIAQLQRVWPDPGAWPESLRARLADRPVALVVRAIEAGVNAPSCTSAGRLFDAVAAALGLVAGRQDYEGEAAMRLQAAAGSVDPARVGNGYRFHVTKGAIDPAPIWLAIADDLDAGELTSVMAARFHAGLASALVTAVSTLQTSVRSKTVLLDGGVFNNALLAERLLTDLTAAGFTPFLPADIPVGDGGLAVGQVAIAIARWQAGERG